IRWGDRRGDPLVFLHGLMNNARYWERIAQRFAARHAVYAPDLRGHGESEHAPGGYLVWAFAMDLRGLVEELDFEAFDLVTHSIGSRVALAYARDHSHRLRHLVLADMAPQAVAPLAASAPEGAGRRGFATEAEAIAHFAAMYPGQPHDFLARQLAASLALDEGSGNLVFRFDPAIEQATGPAATVEIPYLWESLEHVTCPVLVVRATDGAVLSKELAQEMVRRLPHGRLVELPGASDDVPLHEPEAFTDAVREFLAE
ncbi:MAG: alpha/beta fold hydrolase, partial [Tepidiformaceae bacterium]